MNQRSVSPVSLVRPVRLPARTICLLVAAGLGASCGNPATSSKSAPLVFKGSNLGPDEIPLEIDQQCPGGPDCADEGDGQLLVGAAKRDVTPLLETFQDLNGNLIRDEDEPYDDRNHNGRFDPVFLAGRDPATYAFGVHDPVWVRCYAVRQNKTTFVHCVVDALGIFQYEEQQIRADLDPALGVDMFMIAATHDHQSKDLIGFYGYDLLTTGYDDDYMRWLRGQFVGAITDAVHSLQPAKMAISAIKMMDPSDGPEGTGDMTHYVGDTRDPRVIDPYLHLMQFDAMADDKPIVTVVNWGAHPDSLGSDRHQVSSDWVHYFRQSLEAGTGSDVVFVQGQCGGQVGPGDVRAVTDDGTELGDGSYPFVEAWGKTIARMALKAFAARSPVAAPKLAFRHTTFGVHTENPFYETLFIDHLIRREVYGYDPARPLLRDESGDNTPLTPTEVAYITLGPASIITCPAELLPENFLGGYDGSYAGTYQFINTSAPNAPNPALAPKAPYLRDMMDGDEQNKMVYGLTLDFLGYIVPRYNFFLDPVAPYVVSAPGDHYEETNSIGPRAEPEIVGTMRQLVLSTKPDWNGGY